MAELTHFRLIFVFQNPGKHRKISDFLVFRRYRKEKWLLILIINFDSFKCFNPMFVFLTTKGYFTSFHIIYLTKSNYLCECLVFFVFFFVFVAVFFAATRLWKSFWNTWTSARLLLSLPITITEFIQLKKRYQQLKASLFALLVRKVCLKYFFMHFWHQM